METQINYLGGDLGDLAYRIFDLESRVDDLESQAPSASQISDLEYRISDLESRVNDLENQISESEWQSFSTPTSGFEAFIAFAALAFALLFGRKGRNGNGKKE